MQFNSAGADTFQHGELFFRVIHKRKDVGKILSIMKPFPCCPHPIEPFMVNSESSGKVTITRVYNVHSAVDSSIRKKMPQNGN